MGFFPLRNVVEVELASVSVWARILRGIEAYVSTLTYPSRHCVGQRTVRTSRTEEASHIRKEILASQEP
jgi:hypothetical protein